MITPHAVYRCFTLDTPHDAARAAFVDVAALYVRRDSEYKNIPGIDCYDIDRDAQSFPGGMPVIAHPPCRLWSRLRSFSTADPSEKALAFHAVEMVDRWGGVLEHPAGSTLWREANLPLPGDMNNPLRYTLDIDQFWFGYEAVKRTWLYIVGVPIQDINYPIRLDRIDYVIDTRKKINRTKRYLPKSKRDYTTIQLANWLVSVARLSHATAMSRCR